MKFTGERFIPGQCDEALTLEHMNRYRFAAALVSGRRVLDIACGAGYGSAMLAETAAQVTGMDISEEAVAHCRETYAASNLSFAPGDIRKIPMPDKSVDVIVSFETMEHVSAEAQADFVREAARVLAPGGLMIVSTPNREVYCARGENEFHVHELAQDEFVALMKSAFRNVALCGQMAESCNLIFTEGRLGHISEGPELAQAEYLIAVCSDAELPALAPSVMPRRDGCLKQLSDWAAENDRRIGELSEWGQRLDGEIARRDARIMALNDEVQRLSDWGGNLDREIAGRDETIAALNARVEELSAWGQKLDAELAMRDALIVQQNMELELTRAWKAQQDKLAGMLARQGEKLEALGLQMEAARKKYDEETAALRENLACREQELDAMCKEKALREAELHAAMDEKAALEQNVAAMAGRLEEVRAEAKHHKGHVEALEDVVDRRNETIAALEADKVSLQQKISQLEEKELQLYLIENSKAWKVGRALQRTSAVVIPMGSRRRLVARYTLKFLRHPIRMIRGMDMGKIRNFRGRLIHGDSANTYMPSVNDIAQLRKQQAVKPVQARKASDYEAITFPAWPNPKVSIVIPVYNQFEYTYECLRSILRNTENVTYEVIIANDCSTDLTAQMGRIVKNVRVVTNKTNLRFLRNCNNAAKHAKGEYIFFLNNDTQVQEGWLESLVELMDKDGSIGMAGSKLVFSDGRLQEAGGILWKDGSAWNYGRLGDPEASQFNYVKDVDYISGAAIMIRHALWKELGGFDETFAPAYNEDSDLAFMVRAKGVRMVYQPKSVVVHFEGVSNGTDTSSGQKAYQVVNQKKFFEKWQDVLAREHFENGQNVFQARDRSRGKKTILVVDHYVPHFDMDAGSRTVYQYLKLFVSKGMNVKFIGDNFYRHEPYTTALQQMGIEVLYGPEYAQGWENWLKENGQYFDYVMLNRPHISEKYIDAVRRHTRAKIFYYGHDLHFLREQRRYEMTGDREALKLSEEWFRKEQALMHKADEVWYPSQVEVDEIKKRDASINARAIPAYLFDSSDPVPYRASERRDVMFIGGFAHAPNVDAVKWFHDEVWPQVRTKDPNMRVYIIGSKPPKEIEAMNSKRFIVTGRVSDEELDEYYHKCRMAVVPLRYGAGIKGKVVEAMYHRLPVLTTSVGAEGIDCSKDALAVRDNAQAFAGALVKLYGKTDVLDGMSEQYDRFIREVYSFEHAAETLSAEFDGWERG